MLGPGGERESDRWGLEGMLTVGGGGGGWGWAGRALTTGEVGKFGGSHL